ncbi:hypothetical protein F5Y13DRAFT_192048 [Hypoxylon sp. FL1857]|nr:hypothetical protein F5Y13DRAFT_192048 [Hypoxylon sp. FL1857]
MGNQYLVVGWVKVVVFLLLTQTHLADGLSWGRGPKTDFERQDAARRTTTGGTVSQLMESGSSLSRFHEIALNELRELESEPLCHRTAARLLVNNCELLEGKDEATFLTDSGRKIRDFVDSYAASLAICDLERGGFHIPRECANFQEPILNQLPLQNLGQLHSTWVSYRHKALRFCEVARADNEKAQHILLFQRLTKIMGRFTDDVDKQFEQRFNNLDLRAQATGGRIDELSPKVDRLSDSLKSVEMFFNQLIHSVKETTDAVNSGKENALNLQQMLEVVFKNIVEGQAEVALNYEQSMQVATQRTESVMDIAMGVVVAVTESAAQLQSQVELSRLRAAELESRQDKLEQASDILAAGEFQNLATTFDDHTNRLLQASNITNEILDTLEDTAVSAANVGNSIFKQSSSSSWWPYIWCPAASIVLGSYGLPPSATRNFALLALAKVSLEETIMGDVAVKIPISERLASHKPTSRPIWNASFMQMVDQGVGIRILRRD